MTAVISISVVLQECELFCKDGSCSARMGVVLQGWELFCKDESCSARMGVVLQGWELFCKGSNWLARGCELFSKNVSSSVLNTCHLVPKDVGCFARASANLQWYCHSCKVPAVHRGYRSCKNVCRSGGMPCVILEYHLFCRDAGCLQWHMLLCTEAPEVVCSARIPGALQDITCSTRARLFINYMTPVLQR
jgi:hypothetical protein